VNPWRCQLEDHGDEMGPAMKTYGNPMKTYGNPMKSNENLWKPP